MKVPSREQREAMERLGFTKDGKTFARFLDEAFAEVTTRIVVDEDASHVRVFQGEARTLRMLQSYLSPVSSETTR